MIASVLNGSPDDMASAFQVSLWKGLLLKTIIHLEQALVPLQHNWPTLSEAGFHLRLNKKVNNNNQQK